MNINDYIKINKIPVNKFAKDLGLHRTTVYSWLANRSKPRVDAALKIESITGGKVSFIEAVQHNMQSKKDTT